MFFVFNFLLSNNYNSLNEFSIRHQVEFPHQFELVSIIIRAAVVTAHLSVIPKCKELLD